MIKVAHFIDSPDPGGAESIVIELCIEQIRHNIDVEVLHFKNSWLEDKCNQYNIRHKRVPFYYLYKSIYTLPVFCIIFTIFLLTRRLDIIHTHLFDTILPTVPASIIARISHIATLHDIFSIENNKIRHQIINCASRAGTIIVAVSKQIIDHIDSLGFVKPGSVYLVRNGVDLNKYNPVNLQNDVKYTLNVDSDTVVIVSVGRLVPIKAYDNLLASFKLVHDNFNKVTLYIIGDGPELDNLILQTQKLNIVKNVIFLGHRDDVPDILRQADIFALSSLSEGLSCSIIEAMASGLPIIATNVGGNGELVHSNINGYLVPTGDIVEFHIKLLELVEDKNKREQYSFMSRSIANSEFSTVAMSDKYSKLYTKLLTG